MRIQRVINNKDANKNNTGTSSDSSIDLKKIEPLLEKYKGKDGNLIPILQGVQNEYGYIPKEAFIKINKELGLELASMYGVATFYSQFRLNPVGKHIIKVCHGTACHVQNASKITDALMDSLKINDGETTDDKLFTLESVACLGCCSLAPVMMIGDNTYGKLDGKSAVRVIKDIKLSENKKSQKV
jgi:NADH-quinone oxidoreductase subunit E